MRRILLACLGMFFFVQLSSGQANDWVTLVGESGLDGWIQRGGKAVYENVGSQVTGTAVKNSPNSFLCTDRDYSDFELELEFWVDDGLNSGVQIRSASRSDYKQGRVHGYQVEIDPSDRSWSAGIYDESRDGWLFTLEDNAAAREAFKHSTWNSLRVVAQGRRIQTWLNGVPAADFENADVPSGFVALQVHSVPKENVGKQVRWRNVRIRELTEAGDSASETQTSLETAEEAVE